MGSPVRWTRKEGVSSAERNDRASMIGLTSNSGTDAAPWIMPRSESCRIK